MCCCQCRDFLSPETLSCYVVEEGSLRERQPQQEIAAIIGYKSDIWAMGIILYQVCYRQRFLTLESCKLDHFMTKTKKF